jgi:hypothetical protein
MNTKLLTDHRSASLLKRVRHDISNLRDDISNLLTHTTKETLPNSARDLADQARSQLAAGGAFAASRLRDLRRQTPSPGGTAGLVGGALLAGVLAYGVYALCRSCCCNGGDCENSNE